MSFNWNNYFSLAIDLAKDQDEAKMRSAISRGYYCAYHIALDYLKKDGRTADGHTNLWDQFTSYEDNKKLVGSWGHRARLIRNKADYDDQIKNIETDWKVIKANVQYIIDELK